MKPYINVDLLSQSLRRRTVDTVNKKICLAKISGSKQENDIISPVNCNGFGRIHHFQFNRFDEWPVDPLPMAPAAKYLDITPIQDMTAEVFQLASCNFRCWYCFVPYSLLSPNYNNSEWKSCEELVSMYSNISLSQRPKIIDCSGGHPELAPEWIPWMMEALINQEMASSTFLWSDDNLSTDFMWRYLTDDQLELIASYPGYARVACFKGFDYESFSYNTSASPELYDRQFDLFSRLLDLQIDLYAYVTFTSKPLSNITDKINLFIDRLQSIDPMLPLRTVPIKILPFGVTLTRVSDLFMKEADKWQTIAMRAWVDELQKRFSSQDLSLNISEVRFSG